MSILQFLQNVDRRFLYVLVLFTVAIPFFFPMKIPITVQPATEALYDAIEALPPNSFVLLSMDWGAATRGENRPQSIAFITHLMRKHVRFGMLSFEPTSKTLSQGIAEDLAKQYHYTYGTDWVNFGYRADQDNYLKGFVHDVPGILSTDIKGQPVATMPVMQGVHTAKDIAMLLDVTPSDTYNSYVKFVQGPYQVPLGVALTSVMAPEAFNRLDSHQIVGLMGGLQGGVEYEQKLGYVGKATQASLSSSFAHFLIIGLILMGNVAMLAERKLKSRAGSH